MNFSNVVTKDPPEWILTLIPFPDMVLMGHKNRPLIGGLYPPGEDLINRDLIFSKEFMKPLN